LSFVSKIVESKKQIVTGNQVYDAIKAALPSFFEGEITRTVAFSIFETCVQNLSFRAPAENYEYNNADRKNGLRRFYENISKKYPDPEVARKIFLHSLTNNIAAYVLTPHPTETLTNDSIAAERKLSEVMHSKDFMDWSENGFEPGHKVVGKLKNAVEGLHDKLSSEVIEENLRLDQESVRGIKFTERFYDAVELIIHDVDKALRDVGGKELQHKEITKFVLEAENRLFDVLGWAATDQDGKQNARPAYIEDLMEKSSRAMAQLYMVEFAKLYNNYANAHPEQVENNREYKHDVKQIIKDLILRIDNPENLKDFYSKPESERQEIFLKEKKEASRIRKNKTDEVIKFESPNIARHLERMKRASINRGFGIDENIVSVFEESIQEIIDSEQKQSGFAKNYKDQLIERTKILADKYLQDQPVHVLSNGIETPVNTFDMLMAKIATFGSQALKSQIRQNSRDIESAFIYVLKDIKNEGNVELPEVYESLLVQFSLKTNIERSIKDIKQNLEEDQLAIMKSSDPENIIKNRIYTKKHELLVHSNLLADIEPALNKNLLLALADIKNNKELGDAFKEFVVSRDKIYKSFLAPSELAKKLSDLSADYGRAEDIEKDIIAYDRLKTIQLAVDNPEKIPDMISAESNVAITIPIQHFLAQAVSKTGKVLNKIFSLPESKETIQSSGKDWANLLSDENILAQINSTGMPAPKKYDEQGNPIYLTKADILRFMGVPAENITSSDHEVKITESHIGMYPQSDVVKVTSVPSAGFLIAQAEYEMTLNLAEKGIFYQSYRGGGSSPWRGNPVDGAYQTIQGRAMRMSQEAVEVMTVNRKTKQGSVLNELIGNGYRLEKTVSDGDPRSHHSNSNWGNYRAINQQPEKWKKYYNAFVNKVGGAYSELYESDAFGIWFSTSSLQEAAKIASYSARATNKAGDKDAIDYYPSAVDPKGMRAIQFGMATSALIPHGGMMIYKAFENDKGELDVEMMNEILKDYRAGKVPALQEAINKSATCLAMADLNSSWEIAGFTRLDKGAKGCIKLNDENILISEIATGKHDELIKQHLLSGGIYKHIKEPEIFDKKIENEIISIRTLAQMDIATVKSRDYIAIVLNAVKDHSVNIDQQNIDEIKNKESRNVILDSLPTLQREELKLLNTKRKEAFEELADISNDLKHGKDTPPKRKPDGTIVNKNLYERIAYNMQVLYETGERAVSGVLRTDYARDYETSLFAEKAGFSKNGIH
jgi:hypothetical protein